MNLQLRKAIEADMPAISEVVLAAFGHEQGQEIADLVYSLLADPSAKPLLSLIATHEDVVVGHILFTNVHIIDAQRKLSAAILAPLSVHPGYQGQGIGGRLIEEGIRQLKEAGVELVFVLGHPAYYPKFGFSPAGVRGFDAPYPIARENAGAWMVMELQPGVIGQVSGQLACADALNNPRHWQE